MVISKIQLMGTFYWSFTQVRKSHRVEDFFNPRPHHCLHGRKKKKKTHTNLLIGVKRFLFYFISFLVSKTVLVLPKKSQMHSCKKQAIYRTYLKKYSPSSPHTYNTFSYLSRPLSFPYICICVHKYISFPHVCGIVPYHSVLQLDVSP